LRRFDCLAEIDQKTTRSRNCQRGQSNQSAALLAPFRKQRQAGSKDHPREHHPDHQESPIVVFHKIPSELSEIIGFIARLSEEALKLVYPNPYGKFSFPKNFDMTSLPQTSIHYINENLFLAQKHKIHPKWVNNGNST
jgi:hypothetical protein